MKKIFWTSIVWILLFIFFLAYMRFFNLDWGTKFCKILNVYDCNGLEAEQMIEEEVMGIDGEIITEPEIEDIVVDEINEKKDNADRDKLFEQLDRIESVVIKNNKIEKTEEQLFDEFKERYNQENDNENEEQN